MLLDHHEISRNQCKSDILLTWGHFRLSQCFLPDQGVHKIAKKICVECFFQFLMLNISLIKDLLHKPSETQWNITGTLPGKLKRKISWALSYKILSPEITDLRNCHFGGYFGDLGTNVEFSWFFLWFCEFLKVSASIFWLKTVSTLN